MPIRTSHAIWISCLTALLACSEQLPARKTVPSTGPSSPSADAKPQKSGSVPDQTDPANPVGNGTANPPSSSGGGSGTTTPTSIPASQLGWDGISFKATVTETIIPTE